MTSKFSATADDETLATARRRVKAGMAPNFSAYVQRALDHENMAGTLDDLLDELDAEYGPPSAEATAWARKVLGL